MGETGFDLSADVVSHAHCKGLAKKQILEVQDKGFQVCVSLAAQKQLPLIVHSRSAAEHTYSQIEQALTAGVPHIMIHCYGGSVQDLQKLSMKGVFASFGGVVTWTTAKRMKDAAKSCAANSLMVETDSPDLSPVLSDGTQPQKMIALRRVHCCTNCSIA